MSQTWDRLRMAAEFSHGGRRAKAARGPNTFQIFRQDGLGWQLNQASVFRLK